MKPVIITLNSDNKVVMSIEEFKRHMDSAYNQGWSDGNCSGTTINYPYSPNQWWYSINAINTTETTPITINTATSECNITSVLDGAAITGTTNATSIKNYIKAQGE